MFLPLVYHYCWFEDQNRTYEPYAYSVPVRINFL